MESGVSHLAAIRQQQVRALAAVRIKNNVETPYHGKYKTGTAYFPESESGAGLYDHARQSRIYLGLPDDRLTGFRNDRD